MKLSAVVLARVLAFAETNDLDFHGSVFYPHFIAKLVERYQFQKFPTSFPDVDESKGIVFEEGLFGRIVIHKLTIFSQILAVETRSNTNDSRAIIDDMSAWATSVFGLRPLSEVVRQWGYVSDLTFTSDFDILQTTPLTNLAGKVSSVVSEIWKGPVQYYPLITGVGHDPLTRKNNIASFSISRRVEVPFSEHKYFSEAPLPTDLHIQFLQEYEDEVLERQTR